MTKTLCGVLLIGLIVFNGCSAFKPKQVNVIEGIEDYLPLSKGTVIKDVPLNLNGEVKKFDVVLQKEGAFYSIEAQDDVLNAKRKIG